MATVQTNYAGEVLNFVLTCATTNNELVDGGYIRLIPNVKGSINIPRMKIGKMLQKRKSRPTSADVKGGLAYSEKKLKPQDMMAYTEFNPKAFEHLWREFQPTGNLVFQTLAPEVQKKLIQLVLASVQMELGYHYINGVFDETKEDGFFNGILASIDADDDSILITGAEAITEENILEVLKTIKGSIPDGVMRSKNLRIFMSRKDFDVYDDVITNKPYKGADYTNMSIKMYKGIPIAVISDIPKDVIFACVASNGDDSNLWGAVALADDPDVLMIDRVTNNSEDYFIKILLKADTNIAFGEELVMYDGRVATANESFE